METITHRAKDVLETKNEDCKNVQDIAASDHVYSHCSNFYTLEIQTNEQSSHACCINSHKNSMNSVLDLHIVFSHMSENYRQNINPNPFIEEKLCSK